MPSSKKRPPSSKKLPTIFVLRSEDSKNIVIGLVVGAANKGGAKEYGTATGLSAEETIFPLLPQENKDNSPEGLSTRTNTRTLCKTMKD